MVVKVPNNLGNIFYFYTYSYMLVQRQAQSDLEVNFHDLRRDQSALVRYALHTRVDGVRPNLGKIALQLLELLIQI